MKISNFQHIQNIETLADLVKATDIDISSIVSVINGEVDFVDNCSTGFISVNFLQANFEYPFTHGLGRVPKGFLNAGLNVSANIFNGTTQNNIHQIFLQASAISNGKILVF